MTDHRTRTRPRGILATAADVAKLAGVSPSAVSRSFTAGASVAPRTKAKVLEAARVLKYRPNQMARTLMTNRSHMVAVAITALDNQFYPKLLERLSDRLAQAGYRILLFITHGEKDMDPLLEEILRYRVDAVVLASRSLSSCLAEECREAGVPAVMVNNIDPTGAQPAVVGDNMYGAETVAAFLMASDHRTYAFLAGVEESSTSRERETGFLRYLAGHGIPTPQRAAGEFDFDISCQAVRQLLSGENRPDALFCANDHMAFAAMQVARTEFGLIPGQHISIVGFDDTPIAKWPNFRLTSYSQPPDAMAERVVTMVQELGERASLEDAHAVIEGELLVRDSSRQPTSGIELNAAGERIWRRPD